jgi:ABC-type phosphate/phosphonate transport system substrate-binding protein
MLLANARMYSVTEDVKRAWNEVLRWALERAGLPPVEVIDWDVPAPLSELWTRADLACAMMCGLTYALREPRPTLLAAPVPSPMRYQRRPVYFTDIVVHADASFESLEDTFGGVVGYTLEDSMSGCIALRRYLVGWRPSGRRRLYRKAVGGLMTPRKIVEALQAGAIDVGPLDSYYHDLLRRNDPVLAASVRVVATTPAAPIPPLVATAPLTPRQIERLRATLQAVEAAPELKPQRETLLLAEFVVPRPADYDEFKAIVAASNDATAW